MLKVKSFQETLHKGMCGPACVKMVLEYWGIQKTEKDIAEMRPVPNAVDTSNEDIKNIAESCGLKVEVENQSTFEDISCWLDRDIPVIVDWFSRGRNDYSDSEVADGHYSIAVGLDDKFIYLQDPEIGSLRTIKKDDFLKVWFDFKGDIISSWDDMIIRQIIAIYPDRK
ncbi:MAG: C39 family peptidase [Candidatus Paceibacterota bacterium]